MSAEPEPLPSEDAVLEERLRQALFHESQYLKTLPSAQGILLRYNQKSYLGIMEIAGPSLVSVQRHIVPLSSRDERLLLKHDPGRERLTVDSSVVLQNPITYLHLYNITLKPLTDEQVKYLIRLDS